MTTKRLALLLAVLLGGMSAVYLLPKQLGYQPVGVNLFLPTTLGRWQGQEMKVSEKEHEALGGDTQFVRKSYVNERGERVLVSIVLSGSDMMTGLHRPERCLVAQGWNPGGSGQVTVPVPNFGPLGATRLRNSRKVQLQPGAPFVTVENVCYYWFVGAHTLVNTHEKRVWADAVDRIFRGYNQRWAMVLVAGEITSTLDPKGRTEAQTDEAIQDVTRQFLPQMVKENARPG